MADFPQDIVENPDELLARLVDDYHRRVARGQKVDKDQGVSLGPLMSGFLYNFCGSEAVCVIRRPSTLLRNGKPSQGDE